MRRHTNALVQIHASVVIPERPPQAHSNTSDKRHSDASVRIEDEPTESFPE